MSKTPEPSIPYGPKIWWRPVPLGRNELVKSQGTTIGPLLTGFSLAATASLITTTNKPPLAESAIVLFSLTIAVLLLGIQYAVATLNYGAPPNDRLAFNPRATRSRQELDGERQVQFIDSAVAELYGRRSSVCISLGMIFFLGALILLLVPKTWSLGRIVAITVTVAAELIQCIGLFGGLATGAKRLSWISRVGRFVFPLRRDVMQRPDVAPPELDDMGIAAVFGDDLAP